MKTITTLIVEDSRLARNELKRMLSSFPEIQVIGEAKNALEAKRLIDENHPELIFLDVQMPGKSGFELLEDLDFVPLVIFTTAFAEYAIQAFEVNALDYLIKPIENQRLAHALNKVNKNLDHTELLSGANTRSVYLNNKDKVFVKDGDSCWFVHVDQIRFLEVYGSYTRIYFEEHSPMIPKSLNSLELRLDPNMFFRVNRTQLINLQWIDHIDPWFNNTLKVKLKGGMVVELSRRQAVLFKERLSL